ncbi:hypothetical protein WG907_11735 [Sphingobium sp. AN558]|uniref:hypothetical protein n=1 Tax=Sphingobium sp. AN558 TaxID=3133442 RepID=UPI0030C1226F
MTNAGPAPALADWHAALRRLAKERGIGWAISSEEDDYRDAFSSGIAPDDYLAEIEPLTEWRGCGCGGG